MDEHIYRSLRGELSAAEEEKLLAWRQSSPLNDERYHELARIAAWARAADDRIDTAGQPPASEIVLRATERTRAYPHARPISIATAAMLVIGIGIAVLISSRGPARPFGPVEFVTGPSEMVTATLADGTIVRLAPDTRLLVESGSQREVRLHGRAYFAVAKDAAHPFRIRTHAGDVRVVGTRFDLQARNEELKVVVVEGHVKVTSTGGAADVRANEMSRVIRLGKPLVSRSVEISGDLAWMGNFVAFESTPFAEVAVEIERRFGWKIQIADPELGSRTVTAWSNSTSPREIIYKLCLVVNAYCSISDQTVTAER